MANCKLLKWISILSKVCAVQNLQNEWREKNEEKWITSICRSTGQSTQAHAMCSVSNFSKATWQLLQWGKPTAA